MTASRKLFIEGPVGRLEAALRTADDPKATVAIAHPHPLYGGTLHNPVIFHVDRELNRIGLTTLRFNFRDVEGSEGVHDDGRGEVGDLAAASRWVRALSPGRPHLLVGYSFGAQCAAAQALADQNVSGLIAIGLPVRLWPFDALSRLGRPLAVIQGTDDEFGSIEEVEAVLAATAPRGELLPVAASKHLFPGRAPEVARLVVEAAERMLQALGTPSASR
ncbi:MAG TPA: alpha/beta fold hydrolase [Candidatus Sulfotelmatobacter sp.]|jgi:alpha/beta superfamily hydrolase|nr:alpha/beta fold hydrolase [Candidatus Sulfotelmatobacter sp.]